MPLSRSITFLAPLLYKKEVAKRMFYYPRFRIDSAYAWWNYNSRNLSFAAKQIPHLLFHFISITCDVRLESLINKSIPDICHFFTLAYFKAWKFYTQKCIIRDKNCFATKQRKLIFWSKNLQLYLHTVCKITHWV